MAVGSIALPSVIPHRLPVLHSSAPCLSSLRYGVLHPIRTSGWYCSTFGHSSLAPFACPDTTPPCLAMHIFARPGLAAVAGFAPALLLVTASLCYSAIDIATLCFAQQGNTRQSHTLQHIGGGGWYCSTFGHSSPPPCAVPSRAELDYSIPSIAQLHRTVLLSRPSLAALT